MICRLPRWIAHRGGGILAPENTLAGIRQAVARGYRAVEFDVMLSGDGTPVLIHDETLARTTNGRGQVCRTPDAELFALDAGGGERIPTLAEALALCRQSGVWANVEIKPAAGQAEMTAERVCRMLRSTTQPILISSFSAAALAVAQRQLPDCPRGLLYETVPADWMDDFRRLAASTVHCAANRLDDARLAALRAADVPVACFTVNDPEQAKMLRQRGVRALFTDRLDLFSPDGD